MKKLLVMIIGMGLLFSCSGCQKEEKIALQNNRESQSVAITQEQETEKIVNFDFNKISGRAIIREDLQLVLRDNGTVWGKGTNEYGELGNGKRIESEDWCMVKGLENVIAIYKCGQCYAVTKEGKIYHWGDNLLIPEEIVGLSNILSVEQVGYDCISIECEDDKQYIFIMGWNVCIPYSETEIYRVERNQNYELRFVTVNEKDVCLIELDDKVREIADESSISTKGLNEFIKNKRKIDIDASSIYEVYENGDVLTDVGSFNHINLDSESNDNVEVEDLGGNGIKKYIDINDTEFYLFESGGIECKGNNEYGQLGDGTNLDYKDDYLKLDTEVKFIDMYVGEYGQFVAALDSNKNIWCWGRGYENIPQMIISINEFKIDMETDYDN